jgi:predicted ATPase/transcriptional regulator with XRE-family HTH domain
MDLDTSFGRWLRTRRRTLDLTQDDLARRVSCAVITIQKLEADERRPSRLLAERLADSLQIAAEDRAAIIRLARAEPYRDPAPAEATERPLRAPQPPPTHLPAPLTQLIGRNQDIAAVRNTLMRGEARLLTLLGPPGIGKTSLSLAVARDLQAAFTDGAYFVALAPIGDPSLVIATIAQTLGVKETAGQPLLDQLKAALQTMRRLLVLDNFEQVLDAAPLIVNLLEACPGLKALVTSRAALHVRGERLYAVPPLLLPNMAQRPATGALARTPAVALFVERAQAVLPHFRLTEQNAAAMAAICVRLDGLPLAIELAATRIKLLPPEGLLARLEQRLAVLTDGARDLPPRHRTLRAAIAWSYELLDAGEQTLFARLGVFVGGCTLAAAEAVLGTEDRGLSEQTPVSVVSPQSSVLEGLAALLDKSLLKQEEGVAGEFRFTMLETIREYAIECLEANGDAEEARRRHTDFFLTLAEQAEPHLWGGADQVIWYQRLAVEHDNLRAALTWVLERGAAELGLRLGSALSWFWITRGYQSEGRQWMEAMLALPGPTLPALRAHALHGASAVALEQGDFAGARALAEQGLVLAREVQDRRRIMLLRYVLGEAARLQGDHRQAVRHFEESVALGRELEDNVGIAFSLASLGTLAHAQGDDTRAAAILAECIALLRELNHRPSLAWCLEVWARVATAQGEYGRAKACLTEALALFGDLGQRNGIVHALEGVAGLAAAQSDARGAARLYGAAEVLREVIGNPLAPFDRTEYDRYVAVARAQLDEAAFAAAWAEGRALLPEQAAAEAKQALVEAEAIAAAREPDL